MFMGIDLAQVLHRILWLFWVQATCKTFTENCLECLQMFVSVFSSHAVLQEKCCSNHPIGSVYSQVRDLELQWDPLI